MSQGVFRRTRFSGVYPGRPLFASCSALRISVRMVSRIAGIGASRRERVYSKQFGIGSVVKSPLVAVSVAGWKRHNVSASSECPYFGAPCGILLGRDIPLQRVSFVNEGQRGREVLVSPGCIGGQITSFRCRECGADAFMSPMHSTFSFRRQNRTCCPPAIRIGFAGGPSP
jgi:hypothetical protein